MGRGYVPKLAVKAGWVAAILAATSCKQHTSNKAGPVELTASFSALPQLSFDSAFHFMTSVALPTSGTAQVSFPRTLDVSASSDLLITDPESHHIVVFNSRGVPRRVIGRLGSGPGEFRLLMDARFSQDGNILAVDPDLVRVSRFDSSGHFLSSFSPVNQDPRLIIPIGDNRIALAGLADVGTAPVAVVVYDGAGHRSHTLLTPDTAVFQLKLIVDQPWFTISRSGKLFAGMSVVPTALVSATQGGRQTLARLKLLHWHQLQPEGRPRSSPSALDKWLDSASVVIAATSTADGHLALEYHTPMDSSSRAIAILGDDLSPKLTIVRVPGRLLTSRDSLFYFTDDCLPQGTCHILAYSLHLPSSAQ